MEFVKSVPGMSEKQRMIYMRFYGLLPNSPAGGESQVDIGRELALSRFAVNEHVREAKKKVAKALKDRGMTMNDFE